MSERLFLVDDRAHAAGPFARMHATVVSSADDMAEAFKQHGRGSVWIAPHAACLGVLSAVLVGTPADRRLLLLERVSSARRELLRARFRILVEAGEGVRLLANEELSEVIASPQRRDLFIGGTVDRDDSAIVLFRGDLEPMVVPLAWFRPSGDGTRPDPDGFDVADSGQTVRLGAYEAATDAILYDFDAEYRRRARANALAEDESFGASVKRLRLQRGLGRGDFRGVNAKEVARIERGEVREPHRKTLASLANALGVDVDELGTF